MTIDEIKKCAKCTVEEKEIMIEKMLHGCAAEHGHKNKEERK